jgi:hypothetical protein
MADGNTPNPVGRPTKMTTEILERLRQAFAIGCTDEEACAYARIGATTLYDYQRENPEFAQEKDELKRTPILKAKKTIVNSLNDPKNAQWYLERKAKDEFSVRQETTGKDGGPVLVDTTFNPDEKLKELLEKLKKIKQFTGDQNAQPS